MEFVAYRSEKALFVGRDRGHHIPLEGLHFQRMQFKLKLYMVKHFFP